MKRFHLFALVFLVGLSFTPSETTLSSVFRQTPSGTNTLFGYFPCADLEFAQFEVSPMAIEEIAFIEPMGKMGSSHVTPTDHIYISHGQPGAFPFTHDVVVPADGRIVEIQRFPEDAMPGNTADGLGDYRVVIAHSCTLFTIFIHVVGLTPEILSESGALQRGAYWNYSRSQPIPVKAGQTLGQVGLRSFDFMVVDTTITLAGFVIPEHYEAEPWKIHTVDPFDYFSESLRTQLLEKNPRTIAPKGGKIDYDIDGRLVGNWFVEGTRDYGGAAGVRRYWEGHLAIVYDHVDPTQIRISIGAETGIDEDRYCRACLGVYGVKGNRPNPASISTDSGLIKYELVARIHTDPFGAGTKNVEREVLGVFLVQMVEDRSIRVEVFSGKTAREVSGFSNQARLYHR